MKKVTNLKVKENIVFGEGKTAIFLREDKDKNICIVLEDINKTKVGSLILESTDENKLFNVLTFTNSKGTKVLLDAIKAVYKCQKKREKELKINK